MKEIKIPIDRNVFFALNKDTKCIANEARAILAMQYFKEHRLGLGHAAKMAGMTKWDFTEYLVEHEIDIYQYSDEEWADEMVLVDKMVEEYRAGKLNNHNDEEVLA